MSKKKQAEKSAFTDVSKADADKALAEAGVRAAAQTNGGGPYPHELLLEKYASGGKQG